MESEHPSFARWNAELAREQVPAAASRTLAAGGEVSPHPSVAAALWCDAWLRGLVSLDEAADHVGAGPLVHLVVGPDREPESLITGLGRLRGLGATSASLALPVPGDLVGLAGPASFNEAAVEAGEAVLVDGTEVGLVPERLGSSVTWRVVEARTRRPLLDPGEADRELRATLPRVATALADLDVARWRPEAADALMNLRRDQDLDLPPGWGGRSARMLGLGLRCLEIVDLAAEDDGGAVTASEASSRRAVLEELARSARRAVVAATCAPSY